MRKTFLISVLFSLILALAGSTIGQQTSWKEFLNREGNDWRVHFTDRGTIRSLYGLSKNNESSAAVAADEFLKRNETLLGIDRSSDLRLTRTDRSEIGTHFYYQQYFGNLPVANANLAIHVNQQNQVVAANSSIQVLKRQSVTKIAGPEEALKTAGRFLKTQASKAQLMILPRGDVGIPIWRIEGDSFGKEEGARILYIDATNPRIILRARNAYASLEGHGDVYLENPVVTPNHGIQPFENMDASTFLSGKFTKVYDGNNTQAIFAQMDLSKFSTASDPNRNYVFDPSDPRFVEAMAYFHINRVHDQWQSFEFTRLNHPFPVFVNIPTRSGAGFDNAYYSRSQRFPQGFIVMGDGNRFENFGLDADVYYHEYGHAVLDKLKPGFFEVFENNYSFAFHEAFGDISACAITGDSKLGEFALRQKSNHKFVGRDLDNHNRFPQNVIYPPVKTSEPHFTGLIVGGSWWDLQKQVNRTNAQKILYKSIPLLPNDMDFFDLRDAMLITDRSLNHGMNNVFIDSAFSKHGIQGTDPGQRGVLTITGWKLGTYNFINGRISIKNIFKVGDTIAIVATYVASGLTPGYNLVPETLEFDAPDGSLAYLSAFYDEATNGVHSGSHGSIQAFLDTYAPGDVGTYTIQIASRLGGTSATSPVKTIRLQVQ
jgi:Zn-dependent metalloprotease